MKWLFCRAYGSALYLLESAPLSAARQPDEKKHEQQ